MGGLHKYLVPLIFLSFVNIVEAGIYKWVDEKGRTHYSDQPVSNRKPLTFDSNTKKTTLNPNTESNNYQANVINIRKLLKQKNFSELNKTLKQLDLAYLNKQVSEEALITAYTAFDIEDTSYDDIFEHWFRSSPSIFQPYLAKGVYDYHTAWRKRGYKYSHKTSDKSFSDFKRYLNQANDSLKYAFKLNNQSLPIYYYRLRVAVSQGDRASISAIKTHALNFDPSSYHVRVSYLRSLTPRWGGSIEQLIQYLESDKLINRLDKLKPLKGYPFREIGDLEAISNNYQKSIKFYTQALESGLSHFTLFQRGKNHYRLDNYQRALEDLNDAIKINPELPKYHYWRAKTYLKLDNKNLALRDYQSAANLNPFDKDYRKKSRKLALELEGKKFDTHAKLLAKQTLSGMSLKIKEQPNNSKLYHNRAKAFFEMQDYTNALEDIKRAIRFNPYNYEHYMFLTHVLMEFKDADQTIQFWKQYIRRQPNDSRAYIQIAGAYSRKKDYQTALYYAKKSSDLGNEEGFYAFTRIKKIVAQLEGIKE